MPLQSAITQSIFSQNLISNAINGISVGQLSLALSIGLEIYSNNGLLANSIDVGTLGTGTGQGVGFIVSPSAFAFAFVTSFSSHSILGISSSSLVNALSNAFQQCFAQALISTTSQSVGVGAGVITASVNSFSSQNAFEIGFNSAGINGIMAPQLILTISEGLDQGLQTGTGSVLIVGSPSNVSSSGVSSGIFS